MTHTKEPIWSCIAGCLVVSNTAWFHLSPQRLLLSEFVVELELLNGGFTAIPFSLHSSLAVFLLWQHRKIRQMEGKPNASLHCQIFWLLLCLLFPNSVSCKWLDTWVDTEELKYLQHFMDRTIIAAEWCLNPSSLRKWPRNPNGAVVCSQILLPFPPTSKDTDHLSRKHCQDSWTSPPACVTPCNPSPFWAARTWSVCRMVTCCFVSWECIFQP